MVNSVYLVGRIGKDPESKKVGDKFVTNFSVATSESYKDLNDEWQERTEWHNVAIWRELKHLKKGDIVCVEGKIKTDKHEDKYYTKVAAKSVKRIVKYENFVQFNKSGEVNDRPKNKIQDLGDGLPF